MKNYDVIVIGAGPGGYVAAIRAAQLGMKTAVFEKSRLGGMCLNWGCVPARRLMESARFFDRVRTVAANFGIEGIDPKALSFNWKKAVAEKDKIVAKLVKGVEFLMKKNGVDVISGEARISAGTQVLSGSESYSAGKVIIATGSRPDRDLLAHLPADLVVEIDDLYSRSEIGNTVLIAGGDSVACEMAAMLRLIGKTVTVISPSARLMPWLDGQVSQFIADKFRKTGIRVLTEAQIERAGEGGVYVSGEHIPCDLVINCHNRKAILPQLEDTPLDRRDGFVKVNEFLQTSVPSVYAIGDVTGGFLAHFASAEAECAVNHIAGNREPLNYDKIPSVIYLDPEIGVVGLTEEQLKERGREYLKGEFPMQVNSKAIVEGNTDGFVKVLADQEYGEVVGVHIVAARASDLIAEAVMCMVTEGTLDDLTRAVHPHPAVSETFLEAGFKASGKPLHV